MFMLNQMIMGGFMIKKVLYFLCVFFAFIPNITMAVNVVEKQEIVKINNISMYKYAAENILEAEKELKNMAVQTEDIGTDSELMDVIKEMFERVILSGHEVNQQNVVCAQKDLQIGAKTVCVYIYVNKEKKLISGFGMDHNSC